MGIVQNGSASDALITLDANGFRDTYLIPYLKVAKKTNYREGTFYEITPNNSQACIKSLTSTEPVNSGNYCTLNWSQILLTNGMLVGSAIHGGYHRLQLFVDINGPEKGPNRIGHDIFVFSYYATPASACTGMYCNTGGKLNAGDGSYEGMIYSNPQCNNEGINCAQVIQRNGWKLPDDYPIKKF